MIIFRKAILCILFGVIPGIVNAYDAPIGIPNPADYFGAFDPIDASKPDPSTHCPGWFETSPRDNSRAAGDARNAYYIDNTHPGATDSKNVFGNPAKPRKTVPNIVYEAGDYVEIHGDSKPEGLANPYNNVFNPAGIGTDVDPIWFVGVDRPAFTGKLSLGFSNVENISYLVFDGIEFRGGGSVEIRPRHGNNKISNITFRRVKIIGTGTKPDGYGINITNSNVNNGDQHVRNVVFYGGEVGHWGDPNDPEEEICVNLGYHVNGLWVLDSEIHHAAEDGFLMSHIGKRTSKNIFVGRNKIHSNTTNALDLKGVGGPVVISENDIWGHEDVWRDGKHKSSGVGESVVIHYAGPATGADSYLNYPEDVSFLFNTVTGGRASLATSSAGKLRVIGNVFRQRRHLPTGYVSDVQGAAVRLRGVKGETWICHNTFYDNEGHFMIDDSLGQAYSDETVYYIGSVASSEGQRYVAVGEPIVGKGLKGIAPTESEYWTRVNVHLISNIMMNSVLDAPAVNLLYSDFVTAVRSESNLFFNSDSEVSFKGYRLNQKCIISDPMFVAPLRGDFRLADNSPCIDRGVEGGPSAYTDFSKSVLFPKIPEIKVDRQGNPRPQGAGWDIGAFESAISAPGDGSAPVTPTQLRLVPQPKKGSGKP